MTQRLMNCNVDMGRVTDIFLMADGWVCALVTWEDYDKKTIEKIEMYKGKLPDYNICVCLDGEFGWAKR